MVVFRRSICRSPRLAVALIVLTFLGTSGSWHVDTDDPDCITPVAHNHSAHDARLTGHRAVAQTAHCAICHWLQTFRIDGARHSRDDLALAGRNVGPSPRLVAIRSADLLGLPSRAPPTA